MPLITLNGLPIISNALAWVGNPSVQKTWDSGQSPGLNGDVSGRASFAFSARRSFSATFALLPRTRLSNQTAREVDAGLRGCYVPYWPEPYRVESVAGGVCTLHRAHSFAVNDVVAVKASLEATNVTVATVTAKTSTTVTLNPSPAEGAEVLELMESAVFSTPSGEYSGLETLSLTFAEKKTE